MRNFLGVDQSHTLADVHHSAQYLYSCEAFDPRLFVQPEPEFIAAGKIPIQTWRVTQPCLSLI